MKLWLSTVRILLAVLAGAVMLLPSSALASIGMSYDTKNRLSSHVDKDGSGNPIGGTSVSLGYDGRGNVTGLGAQSFSYDLNNQPTALSSSTSGDYVYDGNKKRVRAIVDGKTIYNIYDASGTLVHVDEATDGNATDYIGSLPVLRTVHRHGCIWTT